MQKSGIKRCPSCHRNKHKAINEQKLKNEPCGFSQKDCYFYDEIKDALNKKNNIKILKKEKKSPIIKAVKKVKPKINIIKK